MKFDGIFLWVLVMFMIAWGRAVQAAQVAAETVVAAADDPDTTYDGRGETPPSSGPGVGIGRGRTVTPQATQPTGVRTVQPPRPGARQVAQAQGNQQQGNQQQANQAQGQNQQGQQQRGSVGPLFGLLSAWMARRASKSRKRRR